MTQVLKDPISNIYHPSVACEPIIAAANYLPSHPETPCTEARGAQNGDDGTKGRVK